MNIYKKLVLLFTFSVFFTARVWADASTESVVTLVESSNKGSVNITFQPAGYFSFRPDWRKCLSPLCGGIFVKAVNQKLTRCADGHLQAECYVAGIKSNLPDFDLSAVRLLQGVIKSKVYKDFGNLGVFVVNAGFQAATTAAEGKTFVGLENNGIVCITTPCFSADQYLLNSKKIRTISDIDLTPVKASDTLLNQAYDLLANQGVLLASGVNQQTEGMTGKGLAFVATQFYVPVFPKAP